MCSYVYIKHLEHLTLDEHFLSVKYNFLVSIPIIEKKVSKLPVCFSLFPLVFHTILYSVEHMTSTYVFQFCVGC